MTQFGREALQLRLLPVERKVVAVQGASHCKMKSVADPDTFYPVEAKRAGDTGHA